MGTVFPCSQLLCELGPLELCQGEFPCHLPGTSGSGSCACSRLDLSPPSSALEHAEASKAEIPPAVGKIVL